SAAASITLLPSQDVAAAYPSLKAVRFRVETDCPVDSCNLLITEAGGRSNTVPLENAVPGARFQSQGMLLTVESATVVDTLKNAAGVRMKIAATSALIYAIAFPVLSPVGAAGLLLAFLSQRQRPIPASLLALGLG